MPDYPDDVDPTHIQNYAQTYLQADTGLYTDKIVVPRSIPFVDPSDPNPAPPPFDLSLASLTLINTALSCYSLPILADEPTQERDTEEPASPQIPAATEEDRVIAYYTERVTTQLGSHNSKELGACIAGYDPDVVIRWEVPAHDIPGDRETDTEEAGAEETGAKEAGNPGKQVQGVPRSLPIWLYRALTGEPGILCEMLAPILAEIQEDRPLSFDSALEVTLTVNPEGMTTIQVASLFLDLTKEGFVKNSLSAKGTRLEQSEILARIQNFQPEYSPPDCPTAADWVNSGRIRDLWSGLDAELVSRFLVEEDDITPGSVNVRCVFRGHIAGDYLDTLDPDTRNKVVHGNGSALLTILAGPDADQYEAVPLKPDLMKLTLDTDALKAKNTLTQMAIDSINCDASQAGIPEYLKLGFTIPFEADQSPTLLQAAKTVVRYCHMTDIPKPDAVEASALLAIKAVEHFGHITSLFEGQVPAGVVEASRWLLALVGDLRRILTDTGKEEFKDVDKSYLVDPILPVPPPGDETQDPNQSIEDAMSDVLFAFLLLASVSQRTPVSTLLDRMAKRGARFFNF